MHYDAVSRLYRNTSHMARLDGEDSVPACSTCIEFRCGSGTRNSHSPVRKSLLLCHMPSGSDAGHNFVDSRKDKEEKQIPLQLLSS